MPYRLAASSLRAVLLSIALLVPALCSPTTGAQPVQPVDSPVTVIDVEPSAQGWQPDFECNFVCPPPPVLHGSQPTQLTTVGEQIFFSAFTFDHGRELWVTDGTTAGTRLVADGCPGPCSGEPALVGEVAGELVFWSQGSNEPPESIQPGRFWRTDGSTAGTRPLEGVCEAGCLTELSGISEYLDVGFEFDGSLFFVAPLESDELPVLWRTDGSAAGTAPVTLSPARLGWPGSAPLTIRSEAVWEAVVTTGGLYLARPPDFFSNQAPVLLRFPSATADPLPVAVGCGPWSDGPTGLRAGVGGVAFIAGCLDAPGLRVAQQSSSLFLTDGTAAGTRLLFTGEGEGLGARRAVPLGWVGQRLYFGIDDGAAQAGELWVSYGRPDSTLSRHTGLPRLRGGFVHDGDVFISTWKPDSSDEGLWSLRPDAGEAPRELVAGGVREITPVGTGVLFSAEDEAGWEPWITDGTPAGTHRLVDLNPGPGDSWPRDFAATERVFLSADDGRHDQELVILDEALVDPDRCATDGETLCLQDGRFRVRVRYRNQHAGGAQGVGTAVPGTAAAGFFWFFREHNPELVVKVLDGTGINGHHWVFWGGITDLEYDLEVTDLESGVTRTFHHAPGDLCGGAETTAFPATEGDVARDAAGLVAELAVPEPAMTPAPARTSAPLSPPPCGTTDTSLCIGGGWGFFSVEATYRNQYAGGASGAGQAVPLTSDAGWFWFFRDSNPELMVKILNGGEINGHWWVFIGGLSTLEVEVTITDQASQGRPSKTYVKPAESTCGIADITAFQQ